MYIIIGAKNDSRVYEISKRISNSIVVHNYCKLKNINSVCNIIIPYELILQNGFINNTEVSLDELLLQLRIIKIVYGNVNNSEVIKRFSRDYHVKTEFFQF